MSREIFKIYTNATSEHANAGARMRNAIGNSQLPDSDPFLLLDEFVGEGSKGFPDHPHRGFEAVSYVLEGSFYHEGFKGHRGFLKEGDLQWLSVGRGIVHSEVP